MPRIDDQTTQAKRPFKKKAYRPWNLLDDEPTPSTEKPSVEASAELRVINKETISNQYVTEIEPSNNQKVINTPVQVIHHEPISNRISNPISNQTDGLKPQKGEALSVEKSALQEIQRVAGLQRKILFYIVEDCILRGELSTNPITTESLKNLTNADKDTVKTATQRLINKKLMQRGYGKKGKGGFAIFHVSEQIRNAVIAVQKQEAPSQQLVTNWVSKKESLSTYSSSSNINTTTKEIDLVTNESAWDTVQIEALSSIGFTKSHLRQIILDDKLTAEVVQESIYAFAFDLENNNKAKMLKTTPLNYFMGILRSGKPYAPPANYESPQDMALRLYLERKKELEQKRQAMEDELFQIAFKEWESALTLVEKELILPTNVKNSRLASDKIAALRLHFKEEVWPGIQADYLLATKKG
jgi:hypothetical protein